MSPQTFTPETSLEMIDFYSVEALYNLHRYDEAGFQNELVAYNPVQAASETLKQIELILNGSAPEQALKVWHICLLPKGIVDIFAVKPLNEAPYELKVELSDTNKLPWSFDRRISPRVRDILHTIEFGNKRVISPITGNCVSVICNLDMESYLCHDNGVSFIVAQWAEHSKSSGDSVWISLEDQTIYYDTSVLPQSWIYGALGKTLACAIFFADQIKSMIFNPKPPSQFMILETPFPHIGHHIWNALSGWESLMRYLPEDDRIYIGYFKGVNDFCTVRDLLPEKLSMDHLLTLNKAHDARQTAFKNGALIQLVKDNFISSKTAERILDVAFEKSSATFLASLRELQRTCFPVILLTIRTGNRSWAGQENGWPELIQKLQAQYPKTGFIIDGSNNDVVKAGSHAMMSIGDEQRIAEVISKAVGDPTRVIDTINMTVSHSLVAGSASDFFVAPSGAGMAKYRWINNLPGIVFSNKHMLLGQDRDAKLYDYFRDAPEPSFYLDSLHVTDVNDEFFNTRRANFDLDVSALVGEILHFIENLEVMNRYIEK